MRDGFGDDVDDKFSCLLDVAEGVFAVVGLVRRGSGGRGGERRAEEHGGRIGADAGEEAEGRDVAHACGIDGGDQGDGSRDDESGHELVALQNLKL